MKGSSRPGSDYVSHLQNGGSEWTPLDSAGIFPATVVMRLEVSELWYPGDEDESKRWEPGI